MKEYLQTIRNQLYYKSWNEYKVRLTMEELAVMFNVPLPTFYRILKEERLKRAKKLTNLIKDA